MVTAKFALKVVRGVIVSSYKEILLVIVVLTSIWTLGAWMVVGDFMRALRIGFICGSSLTFAAAVVGWIIGMVRFSRKHPGH